jgi:hypothetical protein
MAHGIWLQPWISLAGPAASSYAQAIDECVDATAYDGVIPYVEISNISGTGAAVTLQTSPTADQAYFKTLTDGSGGTAAYTAVGVAALKLFRWTDAQQPPSRLTPWVVSGTAAWTITFRVVLSMNPAAGAMESGHAPMVSPTRRGRRYGDEVIAPGGGLPSSMRRRER